MTKFIELTRGQRALVDDWWYDYLSQYNWYYNGGYAVRAIRVNGKSQKIRMHRVINNTPDDKLTDHINGNKLDNRECNLRTADYHTNGYNYGKIKGNSKFKGVEFNTNSKLWRASITANGNTTHIGSYRTEVEAARAYNDKAEELHKEFAFLNDVTPGEYRHIPENKSSKYRGISRRIRANGTYAWFPQLRVYDGLEGKYKVVRNGTYDNEIDAVTAYNDLVKKYNYRYGKVHNIEEEE